MFDVTVNKDSFCVLQNKTAHVSASALGETICGKAARPSRGGFHGANIRPCAFAYHLFVKAKFLGRLDLCHPLLSCHIFLHFPCAECLPLRVFAVALGPKLPGAASLDGLVAAVLAAGSPEVALTEARLRGMPLYCEIILAMEVDTTCDRQLA